jgi:hypothetical protein
MRAKIQKYEWMPLLVLAACGLVLGSNGTARAKKSNVEDRSIPQDVQLAIDKFVLREATETASTESKESREVRNGKLKGCPGNCYVVVYDLEGLPGGNSDIQFLAVFSRASGAPSCLASAQVGGRGMRYVHISKIGQETIELSTDVYTKSDPMARPSGKGHARYLLISRHLIELPTVD